LDEISARHELIVGGADDSQADIAELDYQVSRVVLTEPDYACLPVAERLEHGPIAPFERVGSRERARLARAPAPSVLVHPARPVKSAGPN
jgi:hypothetical protein